MRESRCNSKDHPSFGLAFWIVDQVVIGGLQDQYGDRGHTGVEYEVFQRKTRLGEIVELLGLRGAVLCLGIVEHRFETRQKGSRGGLNAHPARMSREAVQHLEFLSAGLADSRSTVSSIELIAVSEQ